MQHLLRFDHAILISVLLKTSVQVCLFDICGCKYVAILHFKQGSARKWVYWLIMERFIKAQSTGSGSVVNYSLGPFLYWA